jgi:hypothetical protein
MKRLPKVTLTDIQRQELIDRYDADDIISILEPEVEELIDYLEELIVLHLERFELDSYDYQEAEE